MNKRNIILVMIFCLMGNIIQAKNLLCPTGSFRNTDDIKVISKGAI